MHRLTILTAAIAMSISSFVHVHAQQDNGEYAIVDSFPFAGGFAVASDQAAADEDQRVFAGSGGGIFSLDGENYQPITDEAGTSADYRLHTEGFVSQIVLFEDKIYVAAKEGGIQRFNRADHARNFKYLLEETEPAARVLSVVRLDSVTSWAIVGSNDDDAAGSLFVVEIDDATSTPALALLHELAMGVPVYAVEASTTLVEDMVTVFVGTSCGTSPECSSLYRYDIDPASSSTPTPSRSWPQDCDINAPIRDIVLDETAAGGPRAYVAAYTRGLRAFDISGGDLAEVTTNGWPIRDSAGGSH